MNITDLEVRKLMITDLEDIAVLIHSIDNLWKTPLSVQDREEYVKKYRHKVSDSNFLCIGGFIGKKLIFETSAFYPPDFSQWFVLSLRSNLKLYKSLNIGKIERIIFDRCLELLTEHGESIGYYSFYTLRSTKHQRIVNKSWDINKLSSTLPNRYNYYFDHFYPANTSSKYNHHRIFFSGHHTGYNTNTVVYMYCLKQEYRSNLLL